MKLWKLTGGHGYYCNCYVVAETRGDAVGPRCSDAPCFAEEVFTLEDRLGREYAVSLTPIDEEVKE